MPKGLQIGMHLFGGASLAMPRSSSKSLGWCRWSRQRPTWPNLTGSRIPCPTVPQPLLLTDSRTRGTSHQHGGTTCSTRNLNDFCVSWMRSSRRELQTRRRILTLGRGSGVGWTALSPLLAVSHRAILSNPKKAFERCQSSWVQPSAARTSDHLAQTAFDTLDDLRSGRSRLVRVLLGRQLVWLLRSLPASRRAVARMAAARLKVAARQHPNPEWPVQPEATGQNRPLRDLCQVGFSDT